MQKNRISFLKVGGGFSEARGLGPFLNIFYGSIKEVLGGFFVIFLFHPFIDTPYYDRCNGPGSVLQIQIDANTNRCKYKNKLMQI